MFVFLFCNYERMFYMTKQEKILMENPAMKDAVLKILELLNNENYNDAKTVLDLAAYFIKENAYIDFELAKDRINSIIIEE